MHDLNAAAEAHSSLSTFQVNTRQSRSIRILLLVSALITARASAATVLIEAESFKAPGGWVLDTQFIETMGSPYLMAHGLGTPVADATTTVKLPQAGN